MIVGAIGLLFPGMTDFNQFLLGVAMISALNAVAYFGGASSSLMLIGFAVIMLAVPLILILKGWQSINWQNFVPFFTHPMYAVMVTAFFLAESYFGWESATYLAEETRNPRKTIPKALIHATLIIAVLGFLLMLTVMGVIPWQELSTKLTPVKDITSILFEQKMQGVMGIGIFLALIGSAAGGVVALPRLILALARDSLFPGQFKAIHPRFKTPHNAVLFQTVALVALLLLGFSNYETLLSMLVPTATMMYVAILLTVPLLRAKYPDAERPFKVPFAKLGVPLVVFFMVLAVVIWALNVDGALRLLELSFYLIAIGLPLYMLVEFYYDPKMITQADDVLAYVTLFTEKLNFATSMKSSMKKEMFAFLGDLSGKTVLEFGCGVGTLTLDLVKRIGLAGKVYAIHFSKNNLKITSKRIDNLKWGSDVPIGQVQMLQDAEMFRRVPPEVSYADIIVSAGMLSYIHDMKKVLEEMWTVLPVGGKVYFTDYTDFFHILPNVEWMSSEAKIEESFRSAGFAVRVKKKKSFLWNRIFLYGIKTKEKESIAFV
jgi:amino acid transporter